jgi:hypothetical protein
LIRSIGHCLALDIRQILILAAPRLPIYIAAAPAPTSLLCRALCFVHFEAVALSMGETENWG